MDVRQNTGSLYPDKCFLSHLTYEDDNHLHTHLYYEIAYVLDGSIEHICNGEKKTLQPGNVILLRPGDLHTYKRFQNNSECTHRDLCISQDLFSSVCNFLSENLLEKIKKSPQCLYAELSEEQLSYFENCWTKINNLFEKFSLSTPNTVMPTLKASLATLLSVIELPNFDQEPTNYPIWLKNMLARFTKKNYIQGGIHAIMEGIPYDQSHICRVFKKYVGETITDRLNNVRLKWAKSFLDNGNMSIPQIAEEIGFASDSYFTKLFKKRYDISPQQYRTLCKNAKKNHSSIGLISVL